MQFSVSMLHQQQTLLSSPSSSPSPSAFISKIHFPLLSSSSPGRLPYSRSSQAEKERRMESVEFSFARQQRGFVIDDGDDDLAWAMEKGSFFGAEDFLVDDLLDLGELETEQEDEEDDQRQSQKEEKQVEKQEEEEEEVKQEEEEEAVGVLDNKSDFRLPAHDDVADLEWVSRMVDDSFSEIPTYEIHQLQPQAMAAPPPLPPLPSAVPVRARRSKRARTLSGSSWSSSSYSSWDEGGPLVFLESSTSSSATTTTKSSATSSCSSSNSSFQLLFAHQLFDEIHLYPSPPPPTKNQQQKPKRRGRKPKAPSATATAAANGGGGERRCSHCGVNKTPQWRTGPMGAKTLCNACGVRYKSGRLLPEYRPACSPTFISHVHSNSHRKVIEMRRKREEEEQKLEKKQHHQ